MAWAVMDLVIARGKGIGLTLADRHAIAELSLDADPAHMGIVNDARRHQDIVIEGSRNMVDREVAVDHHTGEAGAPDEC